MGEIILFFLVDLKIDIGNSIKKIKEDLYHGQFLCDMLKNKEEYANMLKLKEISKFDFDIDKDTKIDL